jgi:hypothetical protein
VQGETQAMLPEYFEFTLPTKLIYGIGILININKIAEISLKR